MSKVKKISCLVLAAALVLGLAACGGAPTAPAPAPATPAAPGQPEPAPTPPAEVVHLVFWDENADPTRSPILQEMVRSFNASQDRIVVEYVGLPQADAMDRYNVALAAGEPPDIGGLQENWLSGFIIRDAIIPLDEFFNDWSDRDNMLPSAIESVRGNAPDGQLYMIPTSVNTPTIWVRSDLFRDAGLPIPQTWDQFFDGVIGLTDRAQNRYGHTIRGGSGGAQSFFQTIYAYSGAPVFDENGVSTLNSPEHVAFAERYFGLFGIYTPESDITAGWTEIAANFGAGISATLIHNLGSYQMHVDNFGDHSMFEAIPKPAARTGNYNMSSASIGYMIFRNTNHPEEAWEFVSFMLAAENNSTWNRAIGQIPTNMQVMQEAWVGEMQHINTMMDALAAPTTTSMGIPIYLPDFATIASRDAEPAIQRVMAGQMTAQELLDMWADALTAAKADYETNVLGR